MAQEMHKKKPKHYDAVKRLLKCVLELAAALIDEAVLAGGAGQGANVETELPAGKLAAPPSRVHPRASRDNARTVLRHRARNGM
jgi:hypothetical protein